MGEEAYAHTLTGDGIIVDKLVKLVLKEGTATLGDIRYEGKTLLKLFLERALEMQMCIRDRCDGCHGGGYQQ